LLKDKHYRQKYTLEDLEKRRVQLDLDQVVSHRWVSLDLENLHVSRLGLADLLIKRRMIFSDFEENINRLEVLQALKLAGKERDDALDDLEKMCEQNRVIEQGRDVAYKSRAKFEKDISRL
jgi:hypothetical protein